jgi:hypothetical protein
LPQPLPSIPEQTCSRRIKVYIRADCLEVIPASPIYHHGFVPARAGLISAERGGLEQYKWSSYPWYVQGRRKRPEWLEVKRVLGNLSLKDDGRGRRLKCVLAWLAHSRVMVSHAWLSERPNMGCATTVSTYIRRARQADSNAVARLRKRLNNV